MKHAALSKAPTDDLATLSEAPHRIGKVTLVVRALEPVLEFYRTVIGLDVIEREPHRALLGAGASALLELRLDPEAKPRQVRDAGLFHTAFLLPARADLGAWLASASGGGARLTGASDHLVSEAVYLDDPEGNGIEIYVDRPRLEWVQSDGRVRMTSDPLDLAALAAAAGSQRWVGFPKFGVVGHVHLQVGALAEAEAFYGGVLGFNVTCEHPGARFFGSGGYHHQLAANIWNSAGAAPRPDSAAGLAEIEIIVAQDVLEAVRARNATQGEDAMTSMTVHDPWGTAITLRTVSRND